MKDTKFLKILFFVNSFVPFALLLWDARRGGLGANPVEFAIRTTGILTLIFLALTLAITPLRRVGKRFPAFSNLNELIKVRRMLGLFAFFYGAAHFSIYIALDRALSLPKTFADIVQRPFIALGMLAFFLMIPLAVTSTNAMIKRIGGKNWQKLHRLTYYVAIFGVIHYYLIVKSDTFYPFVFAAVFAFLLGFRVYEHNNKSAIMPKISG